MAEHKRKEKSWKLRVATPTEEADAAVLSRELGVSCVLARLLCRRGYRTPEEAKRFFNCTDAVLHKPFLMKDMDKAVARMQRAVETHERIMIYGDYDVDGVTSVSLLYLYLTDLGADVQYYIPSRTGEGYGLCATAIDKFAAEGITCIITVDTGITANEEVRYAKELGIDMVITDHHECRLPLPEAAAVVNPHRPDCPYPFKELAGVGVAFKFVTAYESTLSLARGGREIDGVRKICEEYADLMAIGTVADVMPIVDENRVMVKYGIAQLRATKRAGLAALIDEATAGTKGVSDAARRKRITASFIGFTLAPRLNAAGRMRDATLAVQLLLADEVGEAKRLAAELCEINQQRQQEENRMAQEVFARIDEEFDLDQTRVLVLEADHWRQGVIGIVASRVTERYGMPAILITFDGAVTAGGSGLDAGKGSGRSIKGINLVQALSDSADLLQKFGGHELAAGLTVTRSRVAEFRARINEYVASHTEQADRLPEIDVDMELDLCDATMPLAQELAALEPFGVGNIQPRFAVRDVTVERITELGGGKHLKLTVTSGSRSLYALLFSTSRSEIDFDEGDRIDLLCTLDINEYRDLCSVQLIVQDTRLSCGYQAELEQGRLRFAELRAGASFALEENILPDRELCAHAYMALRREFRRGKTAYSEGELLSLFNIAAPRKITYPCMKYIVEIFRELQICGVEEPSAGKYSFDIYYKSEKSNIEKSSILKRLRAQCRNRA
ncbi:MAG: single-stranded-DNA-specific exonuclease RecJ [Clostridia bacterium]|nr:single-stranded-DNA-specific exonuclease RecJ [Clostridia bacterium]